MMAPTGPLRWEPLRERVMKDFRALTDGEVTVAVLDLTERGPSANVARTGQRGWLFTHTTHVLALKGGGGVANRHPALSLTDGHGRILAQLVLHDRDAWNQRLRNTSLPAFEEEGRRIEFPQLPNVALPAA